MLLLFVIAVFLSAGLLFALEPMFGRMVLPLLGGSPSVWNTVMVFYQAALLAAYAYAHAIGRGGTRARVVHVALMAAGLLMLPVHLAPGQTPPGAESPIGWLLGTMLVTVGAPFLLVATTGPLLQRWFAEARHERAKDPYFLYAASNVGSMLGLLAYPFVLEPRLTLAEQSRWWAFGYGALVLCVGACAFGARARSEVPAHGAGPAPTPEAIAWRRRVRWLLLAFAPSSLMLGVTTHLSMDIVALPLLWIIPLAIYLLTFILAFAGRQLLSTGALARLLVYTVLGVMIVLESKSADPLWLVMSLHLAVLFAAGMVCHRALSIDRPSATHLTEFYLWIAAGGALGGVFNALLAPRWFHSVAEYPIALVVVCLIAPPWLQRVRQATLAAAPARARTLPTVVRDLLPAGVLIGLLAALILVAEAMHHELSRTEFVLLLTVLCVPLFAFRARPVRFAVALAGVMLLAPRITDPGRETLHAERSFFGIHRVMEVTNRLGTLHQLRHGITVHGLQWVKPDRCDEPLSYYHREGPAGQIFGLFGSAERAKDIGLAGLGTGALSAYSKPGQRWTYYEIDPAVVRIASNPAWFCYLSNAAATPTFRLGDARLNLAKEPTRYDLLVMDAYTSDAVPIHLLTREALKIDIEHLAPNGVLAMHLSNRYFDLDHVVARLCADAGLVCRIRSDSLLSRRKYEEGLFPSRWAVLARSEADLAPILGDPRWQPPVARPGDPLWTDDYASLVSVLRKPEKGETR